MKVYLSVYLFVNILKYLIMQREILTSKIMVNIYRIKNEVL